MMKRASIYYLVCVLIIASISARAQCLHDSRETTDQKARRQLALNVTRLVNTAQLRHRMQFGRYADWPELIKSPVMEEFRDSTTYKAMSLSTPKGIIPSFELSLTANEEKYSLLLRDNADPCRFSFYSDQQGVIYYGQPIDKPPSAALLEAK